MKQKVSVEKCEIGRGVFARQAILPGETILYFTGEWLSRDENDRLGTVGDNSIQIASDAYVKPGDPGRFLNHSCSPNSGFVSDIALIAIEKIEAGKEIRFDYSTTMMERNWTMECRCGEPACRGTIRDFDLIPRAVQRRYLRLGIVQAFIVEEVKAKDPQLAAGSELSAA